MDWLTAIASDLFNALGRGIFAKLFLFGVLALPIAALIGYVRLMSEHAQEGCDDQAG